jgi:hypothetical protein
MILYKKIHVEILSSPGGPSIPIDHGLAISLMTKFNLAPDPGLLFNCCRQAGKSTVVAFLALFTALTKYMTRVLILSRSHRQSRELLRKCLGKP